MVVCVRPIGYPELEVFDLKYSTSSWRRLFLAFSLMGTVWYVASGQCGVWFTAHLLR